MMPNEKSYLDIGSFKRAQEQINRLKERMKF